MTQAQVELGWKRRHRLQQLTDSVEAATLPDRIDGRLYFSLETRRTLTPFRKLVLNYIYRTALELSNGSLESAEVSLSSVPDEEDSLHLTLILIVRSDWRVVQDLRQQVLSKVSDWSDEWTQEEREDYGRWIYVRLLPAQM